MRSRRDSGRDETVDVIAVDLVSEAQRRDQRERCHALGRLQRHLRGHEPAHRMADHVGALDIPRVEQLGGGLHERGEAGPHVLGGEPCPGRSGASTRRPAASAVEVEPPVLGVAAEAVQQQHGLVALALHEHAQLARAHRDRLRLRALAGRPVALAGHERAWNSCTNASISAVRHLGRRDHAQQAADRYDARPPAATWRRRTPGDGRLDGAVDLLGLDLGDSLADGDLRALVDEPAR